MGRHRIRRLASSGGIIAVGLGTALVHVLHFLEESLAIAVLSGVLLPMTASVLLVGAGIWAYRSAFEDARLRRIAGWTGLGAVGGMAFGAPIVPYQTVHDISLVGVPFFLVHWASTGAGGGFLIGFYDARQQRYQQELRADRTELREKRRDLEQKNERLETFASILSHDLRNPLSVATGNLELARETNESEHFVAVDDALRRMDEIIQDVMTMARESTAIDPEDLELIVLSEVATSCWGNVGTDGAEMVVQEDFEFYGESRRLQHVFENLYRNAIEHSNGSVTVRVGPLQGADGFYVEDSGPGISENDPEQVFEPGYTTESDSTGLGLYIVRTIADAHGWDVTVTDGTGGGARFEFAGVSVEPPSST